MGFDEGADALLQDVDTSVICGFQVDGDHRIVEGKADEKPALDFFIIEGHTYPLIVGGNDMEPRVGCTEGPEVFEHLPR